MRPYGAVDTRCIQIGSISWSSWTNSQITRTMTIRICLAPTIHRSIQIWGPGQLQVIKEARLDRTILLIMKSEMVWCYLNLTCTLERKISINRLYRYRYQMMHKMLLNCQIYPNCLRYKLYQSNKRQVYLRHFRHPISLWNSKYVYQSSSKVPRIRQYNNRVVGFKRCPNLQNVWLRIQEC